MEQMPNFNTCLPAKIRYDQNLTANEKIVYSEILQLAMKDGYCREQNSYFADLYNVTHITVTNWLTNLEKQGYIRREIVRNINGQILHRRLYVESYPTNVNISTP